jgi:Asp-tRNA(Asn)/Glu-tRNA(Gln) amidotransferase A subunit family amidase
VPAVADVGEDVAWRVELPSARRTRPSDFRVAILPAIPWLAVDDQIAAALKQLASKLGALGCTVKRVQPAGTSDWREHHALYRTPLAAMTGARADDATRRQRIAWSKQHPSEFQRAGTFDVGGRKVTYLDGRVYPAVSTVAGQPATAFPIGRSGDGLPIGLQAIGPSLEDRAPIRFTALVAREIGGFVKPDGFDA